MYINDLTAWCNIDFGYYIDGDGCFCTPTSNPLVYAGNLYLNGLLVTNLIIPNDVSEVKIAAFYGCTSITRLVIPNTVCRINNEVFDNCTSLKEVYIEDGETLLSTGYCGCSYWGNDPLFSYLDYLYLGREISVSYNPSAFRYVKMMTIGKYVTDAKGISVDYIKETIVADEENPVYDSRENCNAIIETATNKLVRGGEKTIIPNSVTSIGHRAFSGCNFTDIEIPNGVTSIGDYAFSECYNLQKIVLPNRVTYIGEGAFSSTRLESIDIPDSVTSIGNWVFSGCNFTEIEIPYGVTSIGHGAFYECYRLRRIVLPNSVTNIGEDAFFDTSLESIDIPNSVANIGSCAFYSNSNLKKVTSYISKNAIFEVPSNIVDAKCTLYVPAGATQAYTTKGWNRYFTIVEMEPEPITELEIVDGSYSEFIVDEDTEYGILTYTRTLPNTKWNALYVPFELPYSVISDKYDVAYINDVDAYDTDDNGEIDDLAMEIIRIKGGTLKANYPYMIKAKTAADRNMSITLENAVLRETKEVSLDCSSVYQQYTITGIYSRKTAEELTGKLAISVNGAWQPLAAGTALNPFRLYLSINNRDDSPVKVESVAMSRVRIVESSETTGVESVILLPKEEMVIFDLSGRRVKQPVKGGVYIVNGKKVLF